MFFLRDCIPQCSSPFLRINYTRFHAFLFPDSPPWVIWTTEKFTKNSIVFIRDVVPGAWHGGHDIALGRPFSVLFFLFLFSWMLFERVFQSVKGGDDIRVSVKRTVCLFYCLISFYYPDDLLKRNSRFHPTIAYGSLGLSYFLSLLFHSVECLYRRELSSLFSHYRILLLIMSHPLRIWSGTIHTK